MDTYDIGDAIRIGVELAVERGATGPGAIRIDSGDLVVEATEARALLDELGAADTRIVVSSDLDEYLIEDLVERNAPIDAFGVGTNLVTGSGHPTAGFVYKLVAIAEYDGPDAALRPVAKKSASKLSVGGRKRAVPFDGTALPGRGVTHDSRSRCPIRPRQTSGDQDGRARSALQASSSGRTSGPPLSTRSVPSRRAVAIAPLHRHMAPGAPAFSPTRNHHRPTSMSEP